MEIELRDNPELCFRKSISKISQDIVYPKIINVLVKPKMLTSISKIIRGVDQLMTFGWFWFISIFYVYQTYNKKCV